MSITARGAAYILNLIRAGETPRPMFYVAMIREVPPGFTAEGGNLDEPVSDDYFRAPVTNESSNWTLDVSVGSLTNAVEISFPEATVDWGFCRYWALCDAAAGGDVLFIGQLDQRLYVHAGETVTLPPGTLEVVIRGTEWRYS